MKLSKAVLFGALLGAVVVGPAAAEDCFPKVRAMEARPAAAPKPAPSYRKAAPVRVRTQARKPVTGKPRTVAVAAAKPALPSRQLTESSYEMRTRALPALPSTECDTTPSIQAALPPEARPAAQVLLDEIAGPPAEAAPPVSTASAGDGPGVGWPIGGLSRGGGGGGGLIVPPGGGGGGGEEVPTPPTEVVPTPPTEVVPTPPTEVVPNPPVPPGVTPNPPTTPGEPQPPILPPVSAVPEPGVWAMMIVGFFGLGMSLRSQRGRRSMTASAG